MFNKIHKNKENKRFIETTYNRYYGSRDLSDLTDSNCALLITLHSGLRPSVHYYSVTHSFLSVKSYVMDVFDNSNPIWQTMAHMRVWTVNFALWLYALQGCARFGEFWLFFTEQVFTFAKVLIRLVACIGSGDPVRVLRLYTTNTLDEVCSIYCWDICTTCRYRSTCYSTGTSGPTALSVCSRLCLVANCSLWLSVLLCSRTVLYDAFYSYLCRRYWNGILGPSSPPLPGESFDTCSKAVAFTLADTQVF